MPDEQLGQAPCKFSIQQHTSRHHSWPLHQSHIKYYRVDSFLGSSRDILYIKYILHIMLESDGLAAEETRSAPSPLSIDAGESLSMEVDFDLDAYLSFDRSPFLLDPPSPSVTSLPLPPPNPQQQLLPPFDTRHRPILSAIRQELSDGSSILKERLAQALRYLKESTDQQLLVQVWVPVRCGDQYVLTTSGQPFILDPRNAGLLQYRTVSLTYLFSVDGQNDVGLGLPGRVFQKKLPEWTPNVQYYSSSEYPRLYHALNYNVQGSLALPVFESSGRPCIGVVELIMTSQKINYAPEVDKVCKALEAVNLKSSEVLEHHRITQICSGGHEAAFAEILEMLTLVCEKHKLPLAQTWIPCSHDTVLVNGTENNSNSSFTSTCAGKSCMSTTDVAFYVVDAHMWGFRDACAEHHLQKGEGVAGKAFASSRPCFSRDITQFCKTEYPLVHYARIFALAGCLAIYLQTYHTGGDGYVLEFFLPPSCKKSREQNLLLHQIVTVINQCLQTLKVVGSREVEGKMSFDIIEILSDNNQESKSLDLCNRSYGISHNASADIEALRFLHSSQNNEHVVENMPGQLLSAADNVEENNKKLADTNENRIRDSVLGNKNAKMVERRRGKPEKFISLEVLQQHFAGSLKDAAKKLGVCPTTMKRICRQHGISRWPSRRINKVNRSLCKLKRVIDTVQSADGSFKLSCIMRCPSLVTVASNVSTVVSVENGENISGGRFDDQVGEQPLSSPRNDEQADMVSCQQKYVCDKSGSQPSLGQAEGPSLQSSSQGCRADESHQNPNANPGIEEKCYVCERESCQDGPGVHVASQLPEVENQNAISVKLKASYKKDVIRFRLLSKAGMSSLEEEVATRLKLETGTFIIKYLDDDEEWIVLASDSDLEECIDISTASGKPIVRLAVSDIVSNLGSSCDSSAEDAFLSASVPL